MQPPLPPPIPSTGLSDSSNRHPPLSRPDNLQPSVYPGATYNSMQTSNNQASLNDLPESNISYSVGTGSGLGNFVPYQQVRWHWFFSRVDGSSTVWRPFSSYDSTRLENVWMSGRLTENIPTDGGRYDVVLNERLRHPVYWEEKPAEIRRCSWFYR